MKDPLPLYLERHDNNVEGHSSINKVLLIKNLHKKG